MGFTCSHSFKNQQLLTEALTHPSSDAPYNYERLEFLGDAVLDIITSELLFEMYPSEKEGSLAKRRAALINGESLAKVARALDMGEALILGDSEKASGGKENSSNLENAFEALLGAIYLDGGLDAAKTFAVPLFKPLAEVMKEAPKDAKTALQEWAQGNNLPLPIYKEIERSGPDHAPEFTITVFVKGYPVEKATGSTKREAERLAAKALLTKLNS